MKLVLAEQKTRSRKGAFGAGKGQMRMSVDWDSPETNEEISRLSTDRPI